MEEVEKYICIDFCNHFFHYSRGRNLSFVYNQKPYGVFDCSPCSFRNRIISFSIGRRLPRALNFYFFFFLFFVFSFDG